MTVVSVVISGGGSEGIPSQGAIIGPMVLCPTPAAAWGADDTIVFSNPTRGLSRIAAAGGQPQIVSTPDSKRAEIVHEMPWLLPDGKTLLFSVRRSTTAGSTTIVALTLATGERRELFPGAVLGMVGNDQLIVATLPGVDPVRRRRTHHARRCAPAVHRHRQREPRSFLRSPAVHDRPQRHRRLSTRVQLVKPSSR